MADETKDKAAKIGAEQGKNAASWVFNGNTPEEHYQNVLQGIEDGDPEIMDAYRAPNLSGEFADDYSEDDLAEELDLAPMGSSNLAQADYAEELNEAASAYNQASSDAFWQEVERLAREHLAG